MKTNTILKLMPILLLTAFLSACTKEGTVGPQGEPGLDGQVDVYYSAWYTPTKWIGEAGDWYFDVSSKAISEDVVEAGIILAYMSVPNDLYANAVRPMPAYVIGANWDFLIPDYGTIEFTSDSQIVPGTTNYFFRFIVIPSGTKLKSTGSAGLTKAELLKMSYHDVCKLYNIPE